MADWLPIFIFLVELEKLQSEYHSQFQFIDETRQEAPIYDWITIDAFADVHRQQRMLIDDLMRIELELLRMALARDQRTKYKPPKHKKPPRKGKKKKKQRESVDLVTERGLENCYQELKAMNVSDVYLITAMKKFSNFTIDWEIIINSLSLQIIRKYPRRSLKDFIGDHNFAATEMRALNKPTVAHYGDIKSLLRNLIVGMGPISELPKVKSICISGPPKCGKKLLVDALCTEMNAVVFNLSANIVQKIEFESLSETLSLVIQVAKRLQPSVIFIDGAHKPFIRKIPAEEVGEEPRKLGKFLYAKILNKISDDDAVILWVGFNFVQYFSLIFKNIYHNFSIGCSNQPWNSNYVSMRKCYQKFISFPAELDYGTALMTWQAGLRKNRVLDFDASALATVTRNYAIGDILEFINEHVDLRRRMRWATHWLMQHWWWALN